MDDTGTEGEEKSFDVDTSFSIKKGIYLYSGDLLSLSVVSSI